MQQEITMTAEQLDQQIEAIARLIKIQGDRISARETLAAELSRVPGDNSLLAVFREFAAMQFADADYLRLERENIQLQYDQLVHVKTEMASRIIKPRR